MEEPKRLPHVEKDPAAEWALNHLNALLAPVEATLESEAGNDEPPVIFIIGMARSGTTLAGQLLASAGFGYVSNFIARFWRAPALGAMLQRTVLNPSPALTSNLESHYGVTDGWFEPHEFGYFWDRWFDRGQATHRLDAVRLSNVDGHAMHRSITALQRVHGVPISFKNNTWCSLQAGWLARLFPRAVFVVCRRTAGWVAQSLCIAREERYGSRETWWSIRPTTYPALVELPWWEQIAGQVVDFEVELAEELTSISRSRIVEVTYPTLCAQPRDFVDAVARRLANVGVQFAADPTRVPDKLVARDAQRLSDGDWRLLNEAIDRRALIRQCKVTP